MVSQSSPITVITAAAATGYATVSLTAGTHQLEWVGFKERGNAGFELSVAPGAGQAGPVSGPAGWKVLGDPQPHDSIRLDGNLDVNIWYMDAILTNTVIAGNLIGVAADGLTRLSNDFHGIVVNTNATRIGGNLPAERNVISGNSGTGLVVARWGREGSDIVVAGNYIGTGIDGLTDVGNGGAGVDIAASNVVVGGARTGGGQMLSGPGNLISGNQYQGVIVSPGTEGTQVSGNFIGTNRHGSVAIPNDAEGVLIAGSQTVVGGDTFNLANIISGNKSEGIKITGSENRISGNRIGTTLAGTTALPNTGTAGVLVQGSLKNIVGTDVDGVNDSTEGNLISANSGQGILISDADETMVAGNRIGTSVSGTTALPNGLHGILVNQSSAANSNWQGFCQRSQSHQRTFSLRTGIRWCRPREPRAGQLYWNGCIRVAGTWQCLPSYHTRRRSADRGWWQHAAF
ncbi:MAG UNVERIFIED_CONTAM: hypothetical protein LVR18_43345 [Planctomycetaceae bacterium]|jgi:hypothetical protein